MTRCKICKEKDIEVSLLEKRVKDILASVRADKKRYDKVIQTLAISLGVTIIILIFVLAYGNDGITKLIETIFKLKG